MNSHHWTAPLAAVVIYIVYLVALGANGSQCFRLNKDVCDQLKIIQHRYDVVLSQKQQQPLDTGDDVIEKIGMWDAELTKTIDSLVDINFAHSLAHALEAAENSTQLLTRISDISKMWKTLLELPIHREGFLQPNQSQGIQAVLSEFKYMIEPSVQQAAEMIPAVSVDIRRIIQLRDRCVDRLANRTLEDLGSFSSKLALAKAIQARGGHDHPYGIPCPSLLPQLSTTWLRQWGHCILARVLVLDAIDGSFFFPAGWKRWLEWMFPWIVMVHLYRQFKKHNRPTSSK